MAERIYIFKYMCYLKLKLETFQFQNDLKLFIFFFWFDRIFFGLPRWFSVEVPYSIVAPPGDAPPPKDWWHPRSLRCYTNARALEVTWSRRFRDACYDNHQRARAGVSVTLYQGEERLQNQDFFPCAICVCVSGISDGMWIEIFLL